MYIEKEYILKDSALACFHSYIDRNGDVWEPFDDDTYQRVESIPEENVIPATIEAAIELLKDYGWFEEHGINIENI